MRKSNLLNIIKKNDINTLNHTLNNVHPYDIANIFPLFDEKDRLKIYKVFNDEKLAEIFSYFDDASQYLEELDKSKAASIITNMEPDDATDVISDLDPSFSKEIYNLLEKDTKDEIENLVKHEEGTAGAIMNSNYIWLESGIDVKLAMKKIVAEAPEAEDINTSFVIDNIGHLIGTLDLKKLIITKSPCIIDTIMNTNFKSVNVDDDVEDAVKIISNYDIYDLPVLENGILKGIITMDDAADAMVDEAEEDYAKFAGLTEDEEQDESVIKSVKKRIIWLAILLVLDIIVSIIISQFEYIYEVDSLTILVAFQPVILGLAGNCGTQSLAVSVRRIANEELETRKQAFKYLLKELLNGAITGLILGIVGFGLTITMLLLKNYTSPLLLTIPTVVSLSIFGSLTLANLFGGLIPIIFYRCKIDPAVASGPFITTINDIVAIIIYFVLATLLIYNFI